MIKRALVIALLVLCPKTVWAEYVNAPEGLNVRSKPTTKSDIVRVLSFGQEVSGEIENGWMKLEDGYIKTKYVQESNPIDAFEHLGEWRVTAYAWTGYTCANGNYPTKGYTVACNSLPFGTEVYIEGVGFRVVEDRGPGWLGNAWCDLYLEDYAECVQWGNQYRDVYITNGGD